MSQRLKFILLILLFVLLILIYFVRQYIQNNTSTINWTENYETDKKLPYGGKLFYDYCKQYFNKQKFQDIDEPLKNINSIKNTKNALYIVYGNEFFPDSLTTSILKQFLDNGNQIFICTNSMSLQFYNYVLNTDYQPIESIDNIEGYSPLIEYLSLTEIQPNLYHKQLQLDKVPNIYHQVFHNKQKFKFNCFIEDVFDNLKSDYFKISYFTNKFETDTFTDCVGIKISKGKLFLHCNPITFSNYHLRNDSTFAYTNQIFKHFAPSKIYFHQIEYANYEETQLPTQGKSPLFVFLNHKSMRYAWYLLIFVICVFIIIEHKRRQKSIPILEKNNNSSISFSETISKLYLAESNHRMMAIQKMKYFKLELYQKYKIHLNENDSESWEKVSIKTNTKLNHLKGIMNEYKRILNASNITSQDLYDFVCNVNELKM